MDTIECLESGILMARATETKLVHIDVETAEKILALLKEQKTKKPDYKKYISIEWLEKYTRLCCTASIHESVNDFINTWIRSHQYK